MSSNISVKENKFITEINGLLHKQNVALYTLIEKIFLKFIPLFEVLLDMELINNDKYEQLSVIIKVQDYQSSNENEVKGYWHSEGQNRDNIVGVEIYYFHVTENENLRFDGNYLVIAEIEDGTDNKGNTERIEIINNDCIVFSNRGVIKHRVLYGV